MAEHGGIGRQLQRRCRFAAKDTTAPGGEAHQIRPTRHLAGRPHRVIARRVHEDETLRRHRLGIAHHIDEVGGARLRHRAQGFFQDGGQPARLIAGRGVGVHLRPLARGVILPPLHHADQFLAHLARDGAAGQQMFGAIGFRAFRENHRAALRHHQITGSPQRGIGGNAGIPVRATALQRHAKRAGRHRHAGHRIGLGQHLAHEANPGLHRLAGAAGLLNGQRPQAPGQALLLQHAAQLVHLAAQANGDDMGKIRVPREAGQHPAQDPQRLLLGHAAAGLMGQRHHAIHLGIIGQRVIPIAEGVFGEGAGDQVRHMGGTIHAGDDANVIARGHPAIGAADALENLRHLGQRRRPGIHPPGVITGEIAHRHIVGMHPFPRRYGLGGEADDLAIAAHRLARGMAQHRHLVPSRHPPARHDIGRNRRARRQGYAGNDHAILLMQPDDGRGGDAVHGVSSC